MCEKISLRQMQQREIVFNWFYQALCSSVLGKFWVNSLFARRKAVENQRLFSDS